MTLPQSNQTMRNFIRLLGSASIAVVSAGMLLLLASGAWAAKIVAVTATQADLRSGGQVVGQVEQDKILEVIEEKRPWLLVEIKVNDKYMKGYIYQRDVRPYVYKKGADVVIVEPTHLKVMDWYDTTFWPGSSFHVMEVRPSSVYLFGLEPVNWVDTSKVLPFELAQAHFDRRVRVASAEQPQDFEALACAYRDRGRFCFETLSERAKTNEETEQYIRQALDDFESSKKLNPKDSQLYFILGRLYQTQRKAADAISNYSEAIRLDPKDSWAHNYRGCVRAEQGDFDQAIDDYVAAVRTYPRHIAAYFNLRNLTSNLLFLRKQDAALNKKLNDALRELEPLFRNDPVLQGVRAITGR